MQLKNAVIFLFVVSLFTVMINSSGIFDVQIAHQNLTAPDVSRVEDLTNQPATASEPGIIGSVVSGIAGFAFSVFTSLFAVVFSVIGVEPALTAWGVPQVMRTMLYGMLSLIAVIAGVMLLSGRSDKGVS